MRRWLAALGVAALIALGVGAGALGARLWPGPLVPRQDAVVAGVDAGSVTIELVRAAGDAVEVAPAAGDADTLFVLYPGGLVRPQAYVWIGVALAPHGVRTLIAAPPLDLAVLAPGRADALLELRRGESRVVLGGHSLGGAMAARWARRNAERIDGLVLMGAFSADADDLSGRDLEVLVLAAEHDGLATLAEVRAGLARLPADAETVVVDGAVHSFFGRYGPQRGDGIPTVERSVAEAAIAETLADFVATEERGGSPVDDADRSP